MGEFKMKTHKCFALVVQKNNSEEMEIIFTSKFRTPCVEESLKLALFIAHRGNNSFITKLHDDTIAHQEEWIKKFNEERNKNLAEQWENLK